MENNANTNIDGTIEGLDGTSLKCLIEGPRRT
jgi:hypothetical protein